MITIQLEKVQLTHIKAIEGTAIIGRGIKLVDETHPVYLVKYEGAVCEVVVLRVTQQTGLIHFQIALVYIYIVLYPVKPNVLLTEILLLQELDELTSWDQQHLT